MDHTVHVFQAAFQPSTTLKQCSPASKGGEAPLISVLKILWTAAFPYDKELESQILHFPPSTPQMCQTSGGMQSQKAMSFSCQCVIITHWRKIDPELFLSGLESGKNPRSWVNFTLALRMSYGGSPCRDWWDAAALPCPSKSLRGTLQCHWGRNSSEGSNRGAQKLSCCQASSLLPVL